MSGVVVNILTRLGIIGAAKGDTTARQATVSEIDANHNALDVSVKGTPALAADAATATLQGTGNASLATLAGIVAASKALVTETSAADILTAITAMSDVVSPGCSQWRLRIPVRLKIHSSSTVKPKRSTSSWLLMICVGV